MNTPGLLPVLGIIFIVLKLTGTISWSWAWVLSPFWIPFALIASVALGLCAVALFVLAAAMVVSFFETY